MPKPLTKTLYQRTITSSTHGQTHPKMTKPDVSDRLKKLASDDSKRSKTARLRDLLDDVETALSAGVSRAAVLEVLREEGLDMSMATFQSALQRLRARKNKELTTKPPAAVKKTPLSENIASSGKAPQTNTIIKESEEREESLQQNSSLDPKDLDNIMGSQPDLDKLAKIGRRKKP